MLTKENSAGVLSALVNNGRLTLNSALKIFKRIDPLFCKKSARSWRRTRKEIIGHLIRSTLPGKKMCWTSVLFPAEMLYAFDMSPMTLEVMMGLYSTAGIVDMFLNRSDELGVPNTMCSFHRALTGAARSEFVGKPVMVGATSTMCDGNVVSFSDIAKHNSLPFLFIDVPYIDSEDGIQYIKEQLKNSIKFFEDVSGIKFDEAKFRKIVLNINETFLGVKKFRQLLKNSTVNIYRGHELANFAFPLHFMMGNPVINDLIEYRCRDIEEGKSYHKGCISRKLAMDTKRLMWLHIVPQYSTKIWDIIDDGSNAKIVCDEYSTVEFEEYDVRDPLGSIAKRLIRHPSNGHINRRIEHILKIAKEYNVDGLVHYSSWGCHQAAGNIQLLEKSILDAGYHFINLNGDPVDRKNTSFEQHRTRLEAFLENMG